MSSALGYGVEWKLDLGIGFDSNTGVGGDTTSQGAGGWIFGPFQEDV